MANGQWYLATREGIDVGPFATRDAVKDASQQVIALLKRADDPIVAAVRLQEFVQRLGRASARINATMRVV
jgi:hypothetical protein